MPNTPMSLRLTMQVEGHVGADGRALLEFIALVLRVLAAYAFFALLSLCAASARLPSRRGTYPRPAEPAQTFASCCSSGLTRLVLAPPLAGSSLTYLATGQIASSDDDWKDPGAYTPNLTVTTHALLPLRAGGLIHLPPPTRAAGFLASASLLGSLDHASRLDNGWHASSFHAAVWFSVLCSYALSLIVRHAVAAAMRRPSNPPTLRAVSVCPLMPLCSPPPNPKSLILTLTKALVLIAIVISDHLDAAALVAASDRRAAAAHARRRRRLPPDCPRAHHLA